MPPTWLATEIRHAREGCAVTRGQARLKRKCGAERTHPALLAFCRRESRPRRCDTEQTALAARLSTGAPDYGLYHGDVGREIAHDSSASAPGYARRLEAMPRW